jgi:predicted  nucleic acid-binding Zn-ribbon protein
MSKWTEKFETHALVGVWGSLVGLAKEEWLDEKAGESSLEDVARLRKVISHLNGIFESIDPELTPFTHLAAIQKNTQGCINELNAFKGNLNVGHLENANNSLDQLLVLFSQLPAASYAVSPQNIKESVSAYTDTISSFIKNYREKSDGIVKSLASEAGAISTRIEERKAELAKVEAELKSVQQTIQQQTTELNSQFQTSQSERESKFEKTLSSFTSKTEKNIESYSAKADKEFELLATKSGKIIEVLVSFQDDASKVYNVTINTLQGGAYSSYANDEMKVANRYRLYASVLMLLGVCFLVLPELRLIFENGSYVFDWIKVVGRLPLSLVVFVPAFYFAKESGKHRVNETTNRRRQHILTTLDPYVELMKPENAEELRVHVAKTVFSEGVNSNEAKESETGNIISQLANLAKQIKSK